MPSGVRAQRCKSRTQPAVDAKYGKHGWRDTKHEPNGIQWPAGVGARYKKMPASGSAFAPVVLAKLARMVALESATYDAL
jgi:hypothetical protein